jgi:hypothetical protein
VEWINVIVVDVKRSRKQSMKAEELLRRYAAGERDFTGFNLRDVNLSGSNPTEDIFIYDVDLSDINLSGSDLTNAILAGANLTGANFSNANLSGSDLAQCNLTNVNFSGANLNFSVLGCFPVLEHRYEQCRVVLCFNYSNSICAPLMSRGLNTSKLWIGLAPK